jgi:putative tryptophan/tyrosine transport system substrate-binding protein
MRRRDLFPAVYAPFVLSPIAALAQADRPAKIGFLHPGSEPAVTVRARQIVEGLREVGYREGSDFILLTRQADFMTERLADLARGLVEAQVTAIVAPARPAVEAARSATKLGPIIALDLETDPVAAGLVASLSRPGGNLTGIFFDFPDIAPKWLQLLKEALPALRRLAVLYDPGVGTLQLTAVRAAAASLGIELKELEVNKPADLAPEFEAARHDGADAMIALSSPIFATNSQSLADLGIKHRLPGFSVFPDFVQAGGLMAYGPEINDLYRQLGQLVGKVISGRLPAELPVERPTRIKFAINLKTANALGVSIPLPLLARADQVIE